MGSNATITPDEIAVIEAAALLDTTEFRLFNIAYFRWYGRKSGSEEMEFHFAAYMFDAIVPIWVRHLTREIISRARAGTLKRADYGVRQRPATPADILRGKMIGVFLFVLSVILILAILDFEDLLKAFENCYFPPCYNWW